MIDWFNKNKNPGKSTFIEFDIVSFYPSITEELLKDALSFAEKFTKITQSQKEIILHTKKTLLYSNETPWEKRHGEQFDVAMGSYDGAEACEIVALFILNKLSSLLGKNVGLYRDDGLVILDKKPHIVESIKKKICKVFKSLGLKITIEANKKVVNFLDVTLDITNNKYYPYMKPENCPVYVNKKSNHPPTVLNAIPIGINKRLASISSDKESFDKAVPEYQQALRNSGYDHTLEYEQPKDLPKKNNRNRKRKITWFNPPYDTRIGTAIGKQFFKALDECFPIGHKLRKIFNRNTVKLSYSCMPNVATIVNCNNNSSLKQNNQKKVDKCNCRNKNECPLDGKCREKEIVYQAQVKSSAGVETYVGVTETEFKTRLANHKQSFKKPSQRTATELSKYIWSLKNADQTYEVNWKILGRAKSYSNVTKRCNLCLLEKYFIICRKELATLNKRTELLGTCRHSRKYLLEQVKCK